MKVAQERERPSVSDRFVYALEDSWVPCCVTLTLLLSGDGRCTVNHSPVVLIFLGH